MNGGSGLTIHKTAGLSIHHGGSSKSIHELGLDGLGLKISSWSCQTFSSSSYIVVWCLRWSTVCVTIMAFKYRRKYVSADAYEACSSCLVNSKNSIPTGCPIAWLKLLFGDTKSGVACSNGTRSYTWASGD